MVISKVAHAMGNDLPEGDDGYQQVARRIEVLVSEGRLVAQGTARTGALARFGCPVSRSSQHPIRFFFI